MAHSSSLRSDCVAGLSRPVRPTSPKAATFGLTGAPMAAETIASAIARSAPGSSMRTPPATLTKTSAWPSAIRACRERTATIIASRFGSTPVPTRRGIARSVGATSAWISSSSGREPSSTQPTAAPISPSTVRPKSSDGSGTPTSPAPTWRSRWRSSPLRRVRPSSRRSPPSARSASPAGCAPRHSPSAGSRSAPSSASPRRSPRPARRLVANYAYSKHRR